MRLHHRERESEGTSGCGRRGSLSLSLSFYPSSSILRSLSNRFSGHDSPLTLLAVQQDDSLTREREREGSEGRQTTGTGETEEQESQGKGMAGTDTDTSTRWLLEQERRGNTGDSGELAIFFFNFDLFFR